eukprot:CAMPEP_0198145756 /NCGR_PEP_ID=MMETSP1443-20131203/25163_1 /TAXON_ID=186043 /ORGANISM="Entomoneis sp., Strain CCMP2396" /LENGTH=289 /DNA_ID=CAMNT_0043809479 /DNA_START=62 /DNA_END=931 /DNA_ORIENTATION=+
MNTTDNGNSNGKKTNPHHHHHHHHNHTEQTPLVENDQEPMYDPMGEVPDSSSIRQNRFVSSGRRHKIAGSSILKPGAFRPVQRWALTGSVITLTVAVSVSCLLWAGWMTSKAPDRRHEDFLVASALLDYGDRKLPCKEIILGVWIKKCMLHADVNTQGMNLFLSATTANGKFLEMQLDDHGSWLEHGTFLLDEQANASRLNNCHMDYVSNHMDAAEMHEWKEATASFDYNAWNFEHDYYVNVPNEFSCQSERIRGKECRHYLKQMVTNMKEAGGEEDFDAFLKTALKLC